jgi:hypothetical protein
LSFFHRTFLEVLYSRELEKVEIEVWLWTQIHKIIW